MFMCMWNIYQSWPYPGSLSKFQFLKDWDPSVFSDLSRIKLEINKKIFKNPISGDQGTYLNIVLGGMPGWYS